MDLPKLILLLCCTYYSFASHHTHTIPVEHYETELQDLGQHMETPETPVKVIKITKTIAVKIPVPYPVKVVEKVPYPVHVNKPYPVPVPHIVHVPQPGKHQLQGGHGGSGVGHEGHQYGSQEHSAYHVHESPSFGTSGEEQSFASEGHSYPQNFNHGQSFGAHEGDHGGFKNEQPSSYYGYDEGHSAHNSFESKNYDQALKQYLESESHKSGISAGSGNSGYH